jgi:phytoene dehydrogenase-like protein
MDDHYDVIIIGAGLSGLAAGIRLAHFGKRVIIVESHTHCGGLNSWYRRRGITIDVGLHAMTNYLPPKKGKGPLTKLLRQLRIRFEELDLKPQKQSRIAFPGADLRFTNDFDDFRASVAESFPDQLAGFDALTEKLQAFNEVDLNPPKLSAREELAKLLSNPTLIDMILTPLMFYGNAEETDMDFAQFAVMWKSIFRSGFARPASGMRPVIERLIARFKDSGGILRNGVAVTSAKVKNNTIETVILEDGTELTADTVLSSIGSPETARLFGFGGEDASNQTRPGLLSFVELALFLKRPARELGFHDSILFFNNGPELTYRRPDDLIALDNGVVCCPGNFDLDDGDPRNELRVTVRASHPRWKEAQESGDYANVKAQAVQQILEMVEDRFVPGLRNEIDFADAFTPLTIQRFSGHDGGAVYGTPDKMRDGSTPIDNLRLIGTDQGFLGIVGSMLSGITIANHSL